LVSQATVTPLGSPIAERLTLPVKLPTGVTVIVDVPEAPWPIDTKNGEAESVKLAGFTVKRRLVLSVTEPEVPVMVSEYCPILAVLLAVSVRTLFPVVGFGLKDAVTPLGRPETARFTLPLNPYWGLMYTLDVPEPPCARMELAAESVKLGTKTLRLTVVVALKEPEVPVIVRVYCPRLAVLLAVSVSMLLPVAGFGLKDAVTPLGKPETARFTLPLKPFWGYT